MLLLRPAVLARRRSSCGSSSQTIARDRSEGGGLRCAMLEKMNARTQQLLDEILDLPAADRALIADKLEASLDEGEVVPEGVAIAWEEEAERRLREIEAGSAKAIPASEVHRQLREKFGRRR